MFIHALALFAMLALDPKLEHAESQSRAYVKATEKGDFETWIDLSNPKFIKMMGGRDSALKEMKKEFDGMSGAGYTFDPSKVEPPTDLHQTKDGLFCLVRYTSRMRVKGKKVSAEALLLGVSTDDGKKWTFLQAENGEQFVRKLLPEIPESLKFPKIPLNPVEEK